MKSTADSAAENIKKSISALADPSPPSTSSITSNTSGKSLALWSALGAVCFIGASTIIYSVLQRRSEEKKAQKIYESKKKRKQTKKIPVVIGLNGEPMTEEELLTPSFLRKTQRRVRMYFDKNDEMVDENVADAD